MQKKIVVIIGGPGSGKTSIIDFLIENDYCCYPEISRQVTLDAQKRGIDQLFLDQPLLFSQLLLEGRVAQFESAKKAAFDVVFIDRGIPDVLAYMDFIGDKFPDDFSKACEENRYDTIFLLPPWQEIYVSDEARYENFEQAKIIHKHLIETYQKFGYQMIEVPKDSVKNRVDFILKALD